MDVHVNTSPALQKIINENLTEAEQKACNRVMAIKKFQEWPASTSKHHVWIGGLMEHTLQVVRMAMNLVDQGIVESRDSYFNGQHHYGDRDPIHKNVVIMAALFHDVGKIHDYDVVINKTGLGEELVTFLKTEHYKTIHHVVKSSDYWLEFSKGLPPETIEAVQHCILAHHGRLEYGSPVTPVTREAWAVHLADMASVQLVEQRNS
jgi:3'-5' exoribonuclease